MHSQWKRFRPESDIGEQQLMNQKRSIVKRKRLTTAELEVIERSCANGDEPKGLSADKIVTE